MTALSIRSAPQVCARAGGLMYLYIIAAAMFAEAFVRGGLIVSGNPAATAVNVLAHQTLFRIGFAADLSNLVLDVALGVILYALTKPVHPTLALVALLLKVAADVINVGALIFLYAGLRILIPGSDFLKVFDPSQREALALLAFSLHANGFAIAMVFFGAAMLPLGYLIHRSRYLPKPLGVLLMIAAPGYLFNSTAGFLAPPLADALFPWTLLPGFVAEVALCLWLLFKGVDLDKWPTREA